MIYFIARLHISRLPYVWFDYYVTRHSRVGMRKLWVYDFKNAQSINIWLEIGNNSGIVETFFVGREAISAAYFVHKSVRPSSYMTTIIVFGSTFYFIISPEKCINVLLCVENARNVH